MKKIIVSVLALLALGISNSFSQGCMEASSSTGGPQVIGYVQFENQTDLLGTDALGNDLTKNSFAFRRARLGVSGSIPYKFSYYVMSELSPTFGGPYILDAFLSYKAAGSYLKVSAGQFKSSFGLELSTACQSLFTYDRSLVVNELASPFRDQGIMFSGSSDSIHFLGLSKPNIFSWSVSFTNGTGLNTRDNNTSKDIIGRLVFAPFKFHPAGWKLPPGQAEKS